MSVIYKHNFIEAYALGGLQTVYPMEKRGISLNGIPNPILDASRSFNLYLFDGNGNPTAVFRYDIYETFLDDSGTNASRLVSDLDSLDDGQIFALVSFDEPSSGHLTRGINDPGENLLLTGAIYRVGGTPGIYGEDWPIRCAYLLVGKVGEPAHFEKRMGEYVPSPTEPDLPHAAGDPLAAIRYGFTIINGKIHAGKFQNPLVAKRNGIWREGRRYAYKSADGNWLSVRKIFVKRNGQWERRYIRNGICVVAAGLAQTVTKWEHVGVTINAIGSNQPGRSYNLAQFNRVGEISSKAAYDIYSNSSVEINRMVADLNAIPLGQLFVLYSYDDARFNHTLPAILTAVKRVGGTDAIYGQPMAYRGAYMLIGKVGKPAYFEKYIGETIGDTVSGGDPNAAIIKILTVEDNEIVMLPDNWIWGMPIVHPSLS